MRTFWLSSLLLICLFRLSAQPAPHPGGPLPPEETGFDSAYAHRPIPVVQGRVLHISSAECKQVPVIYTLVTPFVGMQSKRTTTLADDGSFTLTLDYALPYQQIWLKVGDLFYGGLYADRQLHIELDGQKLKAAEGVSFYGDGVRFDGADGPLNTYFAEYLIHRSPQQQEMATRRQMLIIRAGSQADKVIPDYLKLTDSLASIDSAYFATHPSPFSALLQNESESETCAWICSSYWNKTMPDSLWAMVNRHKPWCISNEGSQFYFDLATYIQTCQGPKRTSAAMTLQRIDSLYPPAKADFMKMHIGSETMIDSQQKALHLIAASLHTPWCLSLITAESEKADKKIRDVNTALSRAHASGDSISLGRALVAADFGATLYKAENCSASELLSRIARAFPGKAVVIDRWATWCVPCLQEMPHGKQLLQGAAGLPVVFVYLCTKYGSSEEKWKMSVFNLKQPGVHIFIDEKLDADLSAYFSFHGYPGYAFIGRDGKYKPGAIGRIDEIPDRKALEALIGH